MAPSNILIYYSLQPPAQSPFQPMAGGHAQGPGLVRDSVLGQTPGTGRSCAGPSWGRRSECAGNEGTAVGVGVGVGVGVSVGVGVGVGVGGSHCWWSCCFCRTSVSSSFLECSLRPCVRRHALAPRLGPRNLADTLSYIPSLLWGADSYPPVLLLLRFRGSWVSLCSWLGNPKRQVIWRDNLGPPGWWCLRLAAWACSRNLPGIRLQEATTRKQT